MGSPAYFGKLVNFLASSRKPAFIPFGTFNPADSTWLTGIASIPQGGQPNSIATQTFSSTPSFDVATANVIEMVLTANVSVSHLTYNAAIGGAPQGWEFELRLKQDGTGSRTFSFPSDLVVDTGFTIDPGANRTTVLPIRWNGSNWVFRDPAFSVTGL